MKILLASINNSQIVHVGGKHIHQTLLQKGMEENGHMVLTAFPPERSFQKRALHKLLRILRLESQSTNFKMLLCHLIASIEKQASEQIRSNDFDFISVQDPGAALAVGNVLARLGKNIPIIMTLHGYFSRELVNYGDFEALEKKSVFDFCMQIETSSIKNVRTIICVDTRIKNYVLDQFGFPDSLSHVLFNAIDNIRFRPISNDAKLTLKQDMFGTKSQLGVILVARRLVKKNGVIFALQAMRQLIDMGVDNYTMVIAGSGPEQGEISNARKNLDLVNLVQLLGEVPHEKVDKLYKAADIVLLPSVLSDDIEEASSLSMLEGMACGKVVIASAIGGMKEIIRDRDNGLLSKEQDPISISLAIKWVVDNPSLSQKIGIRAHEYAMANHGYKNHAFTYAKLATNACMENT